MLNTLMKNTLKKTLVVVAVAGVVGCGTTKEAAKPVETEKPKETASAAPKTPAPGADSLQALIADAGKLLKDGKAQDAKAKYSQALKKDPNSFDARLGIASCDIKLGQYDQAKSELAALAKEKPDSREVIILQGVLFKEKGDYQAGIELYQSALEKDEKAGAANPDPDLLNNLIVLYRLNKDYDDAEKTCRKLLSRQPDNVDALKNLSLIYFDQEKYALAETIAINSLKLNDKDAALYNNRGMIRVKKGRYPEAVSFFQKAVQIDPTLISAHLNLGSIALRYRDYNSAALHFGEAMKLEPRQPEANLGFGFALAGQQKADEAIKQLQRALEINPGAAEAYGEIAEVTNLQLNKPTEALDWCGKYKDAKGGKLDDKDPVAGDCKNIEQTLKNQEMIKKQQEMLKQQDAEEKAKNPPKADDKKADDKKTDDKKDDKAGGDAAAAPAAPGDKAPPAPK